MSVMSAFVYKPKNLKFESQENGEDIHFILRRHPITNLPWIASYLLLLFVPVIITLVLDKLNINTFAILPAQYQLIIINLWYMLILFLSFESFLKWYFSVSIITNKRMIDVDFKGYWTKRVSEASYGSVEDVTYTTGKFWNILFDYGDLLMQTAATNVEFEFLSVPRPGFIHDKLTNYVEDYKKGLEND